MKIFKWTGFILVTLMMIPLIFVYIGGYHKENLLERSQQATQENSLDEDERKELIGILAKEIPASYSYETIKAQGVIIRTYVLRRHLGMIQKGELKSLTEEEMHTLWGENYEETYAIYENAIKDTKNEVILYHDEMIEPVYHKESAGKTRSAKQVYGVDIPYLQPVKSEMEQGEQQIIKDKTNIVQQLIKAYPDIIVDPVGLENQIQIVQRDESQYVESIQIGNILLKGEEFKKIVDIPSSHFEIAAKENQLIFKVRGIGHGVGFSQNGANELAKQGKNYKELLLYYFKEVKIKNITNV